MIHNDYLSTHFLLPNDKMTSLLPKVIPLLSGVQENIDYIQGKLPVLTCDKEFF